MLQNGIINPQVLSLLARVRHTNLLVIADRGFPSWQGLETVDLSLTANIPTVLDVLAAIRANFTIGEAYMAQEFFAHNTADIQSRFARALDGIAVTHEPHVAFKKRVPGATGLIRTGEVTPYANMILVSA